MTMEVLCVRQQICVLCNQHCIPVSLSEGPLQGPPRDGSPNGICCIFGAPSWLTHLKDRECCFLANWQQLQGRRLGQELSSQTPAEQLLDLSATYLK